MPTTVVPLRPQSASWLRWYLAGVVLASYLTGRDPDGAAVMRVTRRAVRMRPVPHG